jgi:hypothetical protein
MKRAIAFVALLSGCGNGGTKTACVAGVSQACACVGGGQGTQTCKADGSGFGACTGCPAGTVDMATASPDLSVPSLDLAMEQADMAMAQSDMPMTPSDGATDGGTDGPVCKPDPTLTPRNAGSIFCTFLGGDAGELICPTGQECCLGGKINTGFAPQQCATWGSTCTNGTGPVPIECAQSSDCTANGKASAACCLVGATTPAVVPGCDSGNLKSTNGTAIQCEVSDAGGTPTCAPGELQICGSLGDCAAGKTCTPIRWKIYQIGVCL